MEWNDVAHWRNLARQVLDPGVWDYLEAGSDDGLTAAYAVDAWDRIPLHPHILRGVERSETGTTVLGRPVAAPILTTPNGRALRYHPEGESAVLAAARDAGTVAILPSSVMASATPLAATAPGARWWQQLYMLRDRALLTGRLAELWAAGCEAIVLTADLLPDGRSAPPLPPPAPWEVPAAPVDSSFTGATIEDLAWLCQEAGLPVIVKGVLRADDALLCVDAGAAGLIVSNHGGNQLDTAIASANALGAIVEACAGRAEIYVDGGIRRGTAVLKALAIGATAVLVGRPVSYALAVGGAAGVQAMLDGLRAELERAMTLCGAARIADLDRSLVGMAR